MHWIVQDLRYGLRGLKNQPSFTALAVVALGLGIGAVTTIFSVIQNVLLDPFPYTNAERVVSFYIHDVNGRGEGGRSAFQPSEFLDYQERNHVFEEVIGGGNEDVLYTSGDGTERFDGAYVTPNTFRFLGVPALVGRAIVPDDGKPGAPPVFVMAYKTWVKYFNQDPAAVGKSYVLNNVPMTLIGVMPPRFTKRGADVYYAAALSRSDPRNNRRYFVLQGRLKPGVTLTQVRADIELIARRLAAADPKAYPKKFTVLATTWVDDLVGHFRTTLYTLMVAVALLLFIACSNVANLLLARSTARTREMAVRGALGASRGRLISQLLIESLLLALGGAALGCVLAFIGIKALVAVIPDGSIPAEAVIHLNVPVLLFSLGIAVFTALLFGLAPALQTAKSDIVTALKDSGRGVSGGFRRGKVRNVLVVVEVALSLVLLVGAGLLMRTFVALQQVDLGLNPDNILVARLPLPAAQYKTAAAKQRFFRQLLQQFYATPGIVAATETSTLPPYGGIGSEIEIPGKTHPDKWEAIFQLCSEGYFPTIGIKLLRGRVFSAGEVNDARQVAVINQTLSRKFFGDENPIGRQIKIVALESAPSDVKDPFFEIVGIVADAKNQGIRDPALPEAFVPYTVTGAFERGILVRTAQDPLPMLNTVRNEIWAVDRNVALTLTGSLNDYLKRFSYSGPRFTFILVAVFAGVGLVLVALGVYSVIAYTVSRQTNEIGIRMALGASRAEVFGIVLKMGFRLLALGAVIGLLTSFALSKLIASQLWGISPYDPVTLFIVIPVVVLVGLAACYFPARRAMRVDPMVALRYE